MEKSVIQFKNLKSLSIFQNSEDQDIQNNSTSFFWGCEKWFLTQREEHKLQN
jgi:hypothetical protein